MRPLTLLLAFAVLASSVDAQLFRRNRRTNNYTPTPTKKVEPKVTAKKRPIMEVDEYEVKRWGNIVQRVGPGVWSDPGINTFGDAMATPASERHKWFISIVVDDSPQCQKLQQDFASNADLRMWANPGDSKQSWSHYKVYRITDRSQAFRFKNIALQGFPTVLIQPPLNKKFGNPHTVVGQILCRDGDCKKLSKDIRASIGRYIKAQQSKQAKPVRRVPTKKPEPKKKSKGGNWGQLDAPVPDGAFAQEPETERRPFRRDPPFEPSPKGPVRPNLLPNLPNILPPELLPPSNDPSAKEPDEPESKYSEGPEAIIISDSAIGISETNNGRIRSLLRGLRLKRFKDLRTRYVDLDDAKRKGIPVAAEDLPAVVLTNRGRILDKITGALLPNVETEPRSAPTAGDLPLGSLVSLLFGGGGIVAGMQLGFWAIRVWRRRRRQQGKQPIISDTVFEGLLTTIGPFIEDFLVNLAKKAQEPKDQPPT